MRKVCTNGDVEHYEGDGWEERLVWTAQADGDVAYFEGDKDEERLVRKECTNGDVKHYEGDGWEERLVRTVSAINGDVTHLLRGREGCGTEGAYGACQRKGASLRGRGGF